MAASGQLKKIRGGAEALGDSAGLVRRSHLEGSVFLADRERHAGSKRLIAQKAVDLCEDGEAIIING